VKCAKTTTNKNFSIVVVKNNPNITFKIKTIMYGEKVLLRQSERTEENDCLDCLQHSNKMLQKTLCVNEIINLFHY